MLVTQSCPSLATPWTVAHQDPNCKSESCVNKRTGSFMIRTTGHILFSARAETVRLRTQDRKASL